MSKLDSQVSGYALAPDTEPSLFNQLNLVSRISHEEGDIRIYENVKKWLKKVQPEIIFHLAAQPLVRRSYREPMHTWQTNVMGTMNLLEAVRSLNIPCSIIVVTTDKVYENREWLYSYRENDTIGGHDPYSSSKAATEMLVSSWRSSFFAESEIKIATARAGNVIGGGDWSEDRLVPDIIRSIIQKNPIILRYPNAVRPWQHVLEPLSGYLQLSEKLFTELLNSMLPLLGFLKQRIKSISVDFPEPDGPVINKFVFFLISKDKFSLYKLFFASLNL